MKTTDYNLEIEDLPEIYQIIADELNIETALKLGEMFGGSPVYFPILERALIRIRNKAILEEFDGTNHRQLSRKYNLSLRHVYKVLRDEQERRRG